MSRVVELRVDNGQATIGTVTLPSDFPGLPKVVMWKKKVFLAQAFYGTEFYSEIESVTLPDDALTAVPPTDR